MHSLSRVVASLVLLFVVGVCGARAQEASITLLEGWPRAVNDDGVVAGTTLEGPYRWTAAGGYEQLPHLNPDDDSPSNIVTAISHDGGTIVGESDYFPCRWTADGVEALSDVWGTAWAVSADGSVIVGHAYFPLPVGRRPFRWTREDGLQVLETQISSEFTGDGIAYDVSSDGTVAVGQAMGIEGDFRAVRWLEDGTMEELPKPEGFTWHAAQGVTADGRTVIGTSRNAEGRLRGLIWREGFDTQQLPTFVDYSHSAAQRTSGDGKIVTGINGDQNGGAVCVWTDGEPRRIRDFLEFDYDVDLTGWGWIDVVQSLSQDGTRFITEGILNGERVHILVTLPPPPSIEGEIDAVPDAAPPGAGAPLPKSAAGAARKIREGEVIRARVGQPLELDFSAIDPGGDDLRFFADDVPPTATLSPRPGDPVSSSFAGTFRWTPAPADVGSSRLVHLYVRDVENRRASLRFQLRAVSAIPPTVAALRPVVVECKAGANRVRLETTVDDVEGDALSVEWRVNGTLRKRETVSAGSLVAFERDYPHGTSEVEVSVTDGGDPIVAATTVTVQDTKSPIVVIAPRQVLTVETGELYALRRNLRRPTVRDACDATPDLRSDLPARLSVGEHVVTWTVTDDSNNVATAKQTVLVVNRPPVADAGRMIQTTTRGAEKLVRLDGTGSSDPDRHKLTYRWRAEGVRLRNPESPRPTGEFPHGTTKVTLTVTDEGGRRSTDEMKVVVRKLVERRASAAAARVHAENARTIAERGSRQADFDPLANAALQEASAASYLASYPDEAPQSLRDDRAAYDAVRRRQAEHAFRASELLYEAYRKDGDGETLYSAVEAYRSGFFALQDVTN